MNIRKRFDNNLINSTDIPNPITVTIETVAEASVGDDERIILFFSDHEKQLPLNKTNALELADLFGDDTDSWEGETIELYRTKVQYQGKRVDAVRVRKAPEQRPAKLKPSAA
jgi:hypothetical protein